MAATRGRTDESDQHIHVFVRSRPINQIEQKQGSYSVVNVLKERRQITVRDKSNSQVLKTFTFDKVFDAKSTQMEVYTDVVCPVVDEVLMGYNCTIFAYGQTGTGKTYTMEGQSSEDMDVPWEQDPGAGIIPRAAHQLFQSLSAQDFEYSVRVSFVELYNEELFDLLTAPTDTQRLRLYEDATRKGSVVITQLEEPVVSNRDDVYKLLMQGSKKRQTASTLLNAHSSRSHTVFSITVHIRESTLEGEELLKIGKLNLVDLAGSENIARSGAQNQRAREAGQINQSLLTLGRVITALVEHTPHIPYRESKLTRLLQDSLGGRTKTSIIATISPALCNIEETVSTLEYAHRAKNITNRPEVNQKTTRKALIREYTEELERLRRDLQATREKNGVFLAEDNYNEMQVKLQQQDEKIRELTDQIAGVQGELEKVNDLFSETTLRYDHTKQQLEKTRSRLEARNSKLLVTRQELCRTVQQRDEGAFLIEEQARKERLLHEQAKELMCVSDMATEQLQVMHGKVERMSAVEAENVRALVAFNDICSSKVGALIQSLDDTMNLWRNSSAQWKSKLDSLATSSDNICKATNAQVETLTSGADNFTKAFVEDVNTYLNNSSTWLQDTTDTCASNKKAIVNLISAFCEATRKERAKAAASLKDATECNSKLMSALVEQGEAMQSIMAEYAALQRSHVETLLQLQQEHERQQVQACDATLAQVRAVEQKQAEIGQLLERAAAKHKELTAVTIPSVKESLASIMGAETNYKAPTRHAEAVELSLTSVLQSVAQQRERNKDANHALCTEAQAHLTLAQGLVTTLDKSNKEFTTSSVNLVDKIASDVSAMCKQRHQSAASFGAESLQKQQAYHTVHTAQTSQLNANLNTWHADASTEFHDLPKTVDALLAECSLWHSGYSEQLMGLSQDTAVFVDETYRHNVPQGATPVRQDYVYPRRLAQTTPHSVLLERFRRDYCAPQLSTSFLEQTLDDSGLQPAADCETSQGYNGTENKENDADLEISAGSTKLLRQEYPRKNRRRGDVFAQPN